MNRRRQIVCLLLTLVVIAGCGETGPQTYPVSGTATFDGRPIADGDIIFLPEDPSRGAEAGKIVDGKFHLVSIAGTCKVQISALDIGPDTVWESGSPIVANFIPPMYNDETTLSAVVKADGENEFHFDLTTPPQ